MIDEYNVSCRFNEIDCTGHLLFCCSIDVDFDNLIDSHSQFHLTYSFNSFCSFFSTLKKMLHFFFLFIDRRFRYKRPSHAEIQWKILTFIWLWPIFRLSIRCPHSPILQVCKKTLFIHVIFVLLQHVDRRIFHKIIALVSFRK